MSITVPPLKKKFVVTNNETVKVVDENNNSNNQTKKSKKTASTKKIEKIKIWEMFDLNESSTPVEKLDTETPAAPADHTTDNNKKENEKDEKDELYKTMHLCKNCDSVLLIMEDGIPTCTNSNCGMIYSTVVDYSPEWRYYNSSDNKNNADPTRCGNPINPLLMESSFGCKILCDSKSSFEMKRIRKWTEWTSAPHHEKSLYEEFQFITTMAQNSGIPKIFIDYAMIIHKDISEQKMFRGMNRDGIKAASIYISCRLNGCPRTAHEIAEIFKLDKQSTTNGCSNAVKILNNVERNLEYSQKSEFKVTTASSFIERYCSKLTNLEENANENSEEFRMKNMNYVKNTRNLKETVTTTTTTEEQKPTKGFTPEFTALSKFIALKIEKMDLLCNSTPQSAAAGIIYFISQTFHLGISKSNIKVVCGVSEVTIGKCCKKLESMKDRLIPKCILKKYGIIDEVHEDNL